MASGQDVNLADRPVTQRLIEISRLGVSYGSRRALSEVSLAIPGGGIFAIVGPSGCGKSTFLWSLNRLTDLVADCRVTGAVRIAGEEVHSQSCDVLALRRRVGMVFQRPNPFPLSIRRNLTLPLREHRVAVDQLNARMESALREVGLWDEVKDRLDSHAPSLSGGQQQRLCIARALALRPEVILFDEPCSALDPISSGVVEDLIVSLGRRVTVVIVTHNLAQARRIADRLAVFWLQGDAGTVLETGPAGRLFESAVHPTVGEYLRGARG